MCKDLGVVNLLLSSNRKLSDVKLLHACDWTIIEWAELTSEFLQQDSSQPVLDGLKPLPSEEFHFWKNRLMNLVFIQQQVMDSVRTGELEVHRVMSDPASSLTPHDSLTLPVHLSSLSCPDSLKNPEQQSKCDKRQAQCVDCLFCVVVV